MFFDTHAHLDDEQFDTDRDEMIASLASFNVTTVLNASSDIPSSERTVALCKKYDFIYGAVGVHPHEAEDMQDSDLDYLKELTGNKKIQAIGEIGLDYYYDHSPRDAQKARFRDQLQLARELSLPVIIHDRDAHEDCLNILRDFTDLKVVYPEEGLGFGVDGFVIPEGAKNVENAHVFLDYLMRPEIAAHNAEYQGYMCVNLAAEPFLSEAFHASPAMNIPAEKLATAEFVESVGDVETTFQEIYTAFKNQ